MTTPFIEQAIALKILPDRNAQGSTSDMAMFVRRVNRHEGEDERALRVRSSDPLGPESCAATARNAVKRRQGIGGVGY